jgi:hypothetical protein
MLSTGFSTALGTFGGVALLAALAALPAFAKERFHAPRVGGPQSDARR